MGKSTHCTKVKVCMLKYALPLDIEYFPEIGVRLESRGQAVTALCGQAGRAMRSVRACAPQSHQAMSSLDDRGRLNKNKFVLNVRMQPSFRWLFVKRCSVVIEVQQIAIARCSLHTLLVNG